MSYSFNYAAPTREAAKAQAADQFDKVVASQPVHSNDKEAALSATAAFIDLLGHPAEGQEVTVSVSGYLSWQNENSFTSANVSVTAGLRPKP